MKRIDLTSKLIAPIFISLAAMTVRSLAVLALIIAGMNAILLLPEWLCAKWVWSACAQLQEPRAPPTSMQFVQEEENMDSSLPPQSLGKGWDSSLKMYFSNDAWKRMTFLSTALNFIAKSSSITLFGTSVLFCILTVSIDDDVSAEYALHVVPHNCSPIIELYRRAFLNHYHAPCRQLDVKVQ